MIKLFNSDSRYFKKVQRFVVIWNNWNFIGWYHFFFFWRCHFHIVSALLDFDNYCRNSFISNDYRHTCNFVCSFGTVKPKILFISKKTRPFDFFILSYNYITVQHKIISSNYHLEIYSFIFIFTFHWQQTSRNFKADVIYALSFYRSQNVLCRSKLFEPAQKFECI